MVSRRNYKDKKEKVIALKKRLKNKLGKFVIVSLKTAGKCCQLKGILCNICSDFITLIDKPYIYQIKIKDLVAIKQQLGSNGYSRNKEKIDYKKDYYFEENSITERESNDDRNNELKAEKEIEINKLQKEYSEME